MLLKRSFVITTIFLNINFSDSGPKKVRKGSRNSKSAIPATDVRIFNFSPFNPAGKFLGVNPVKQWFPAFLCSRTPIQ